MFNLEILKEEFKEKAKKAIETHGHDAEHNYNHYLNQTTSAKEPIFISFDENKGIMNFDIR